MKTLHAFLVHADGHDFGIYLAHDEQGARDACAFDAGYADEAEMVARLEQPSNLIAQSVCG